MRTGTLSDLLATVMPVPRTASHILWVLNKHLFTEIVNECMTPRVIDKQIEAYRGSVAVPKSPSSEGPRWESWCHFNVDDPNRLYNLL